MPARGAAAVCMGSESAAARRGCAGTSVEITQQAARRASRPGRAPLLVARFCTEMRSLSPCVFFWRAYCCAAQEERSREDQRKKVRPPALPPASLRRRRLALCMQLVLTTRRERMEVTGCRREEEWSVRGKHLDAAHRVRLGHAQQGVRLVPEHHHALHHLQQDDVVLTSLLDVLDLRLNSRAEKIQLLQEHTTTNRRLPTCQRAQQCAAAAGRSAAWQRRAGGRRALFLVRTGLEDDEKKLIFAAPSALLPAAVLCSFARKKKKPPPRNGRSTRAELQCVSRVSRLPAVGATKNFRS